MAKVARLNITRPVEQGDLNPVGMIVQSMLNETQFQALNGSNWILADGRSVAGSTYATVTQSANIPDLRGMTLRGKNNGRSDGNQDPGGERALGNFQNDQMQGHNHAVSGGAYQVYNDYTVAGGAFARVTWAQAYVNLLNPLTANTPTTDGINGSVRVGAETRMRNVAVNVFIKIN